MNQQRSKRDLILAVRSGHNASVVIGDGEKILYGIQEERLTGEKNYWGFPAKSIQACLAAVNATPNDLQVVTSGEHQILSRYHSRDEVLRAYSRHDSIAGRLRQRIAMPFVIRLVPNYGERTYRKLLSQAGLADIPATFHDHHTSHAATAYYGLRRDPDRKYLVLTCDGAGDNLCATVRVMGSGVDDVIATTSMDHSLGALYAWVTYAMGFLPMEHEYKLMGMAPYASDSAAAEAAEMFHGYIGLDAKGLSFQRKIKEPIRDISDRLFADMRGKRFDHICAGLQRFTEEILAKWAQNAVRATGIREILAAGGVFMNVKANKRLAEIAEVDRFEAFPSCGDETLTLGAYYLEQSARYGYKSVRPLQDFYLGDDIDDADAERELRASGLPFEKPLDAADAVATLLAGGQAVARCAGKMEFGARALGNRSILADPRDQDIVRVINQMVKKRDFWMPFAPMVLERRQHDYIQNPKNLTSPYMMMTFDTKANFRDLIAAVHNADLTCRAQILVPNQNPQMNAILEAFEKKTGRGIILNTSYNLHGFPIVRTPNEALYVFNNSGLQHMQVGSFIVHKKASAAAGAGAH